MTRPRRKSRSDHRREAERRKGLLWFAIGGAIIIAVGGLIITAMNAQRQLDSTTLCPQDLSSITVLLVDVTDPMNVPQRQDFLNQLATLKNSIPRYGQLTIIRVDSTSQTLLSPVITRCNPGTSRDTDDVKGNRQMLQRQWTKGFSEPLDEAFQSIVHASGADNSPIMESVQSAALTELRKPGREDIPKRLIVASDLLQNTRNIDFYHGVPTTSDFIDSDAFRRARTDLRGVTVELWQLQRLDASRTQPRALSSLWESAVEAQGGIVSRIYNVSG